MTFNGRSDKKMPRKSHKSQRTYIDGTLIGRNQDDPTARFTIPDSSSSSLSLSLFLSILFSSRLLSLSSSSASLSASSTTTPVDDESCNQKVIIQGCLRLRELSRCQVRPQFLGVPGIETMRNERQWYYFVLISLLGATGSYPSCSFLLSGETSTGDSSPHRPADPIVAEPVFIFRFPRPILHRTSTRTRYSISDA